SKTDIQRNGLSVAPLSFAQSRLWFIDKLEQGTSLYNAPIFMQFSGPLDQDALRRSIQEIVRRHEVLRTTFTLQDGSPVQRIHPPCEWPLPIVDLRAEPSEDRQGLIARLGAVEAHRPFDLQLGPLFRSA